MYDYNYGYDYVNPGINTPGMKETIDLTGTILGGVIIFSIIVLLLSVAIAILLLVSNWKIFKKAKRNGWESLVPVHNIFVLLEIAGTPTWHIFLFFVPFANIYAIFRMFIDLAHKFGKSTGFGVATVFFSFVCLPILAFSKNFKYDSVDESKEELKPSVEPENTNNVNEQPINQNIVSEDQMPIPTMINVENIAPVQPETVAMQEPANLTTEDVTEVKQVEQPVNVEVPAFTQTTNLVENVSQVQNPEVVPMQPMYTEPTTTQTVVSEPVMPVQNETPVQTVIQEPVVSNTVIIPEQNNNNQNNLM